MNGNIDERFWYNLSQEQKNELVFKAMFDINKKLDHRYKLFLTIAVFMGFIGGVLGHVGEGCFRWLGIIK